MLRKLIVLAITSGMAAKLYRSYINKRSEADLADTTPVQTRKRRAGAPAGQV